ncbi:aprataxin and PNK-like factor [Copidosoma floridanum]|uniref:aprataxin and PNK-like factor n=1 Tax=Copidosoma floridanum TaxID=29053 RepID=UPI0006C99CE9|nr:aprataxin and PNK-like factor [Copidosoma floridanum]
MADENNKFEIIWIDDSTVRRTVLQLGENVIGNIINSDDDGQRFIEEAAVINLSPDDEITISPCQGISCFVKNFGALRWKSIGQNCVTPLNIRDTCLLFPVKIWLRVISTMDDDSEIRNSKRKMEEIIEDEPIDKRCRSEVGLEIESVKPISYNNNHEPLDEENFLEGSNCIEDNEEVDTLTNPDNIDNISVQSSNFSIAENDSEVQADSLPSKNQNEENQNLAVDDENASETDASVLLCSASRNDANQNGDNENDTQHSNNRNSDSEPAQQNENTEESTNDDGTANTNNQASTSDTQNTRREKCKYRDKCYRRNQEHKQKFSHPGDADYDQPDTRPECPYGRRCYRKNPQHKLDYKHPEPRQRPARARSGSPIDMSDLDDEYMDESVDESEYEASFIDDDSDMEEWESDYED